MPPQSRSTIASLVAAAVLFAACPHAGAADMKAGEFSPPRDAPDFTLDGSHGSELKLSHYRGKVVLLEFGFTSCPFICPTTLSVLARARKDLVADADDVQVLYVTVDPARDTPAQLRTFLATFDPTFVGGTGTEEKLLAVRQSYGVQSDKTESGEGYVHSASVHLIDRDGKLRALMPYGHTSDDYVHDLKILLDRE